MSLLGLNWCSRAYTCGVFHKFAAPHRELSGESRRRRVCKSRGDGKGGSPPKPTSLPFKDSENPKNTNLGAKKRSKAPLILFYTLRLRMRKAAQEARMTAAAAVMMTAGILSLMLCEPLQKFMPLASVVGRNFLAGSAIETR